MNRFGMALGIGVLGAALLVACDDGNGNGDDLGLDGDTGNGATSPLAPNGDGGLDDGGLGNGGLDDGDGNGDANGGMDAGTDTGEVVDTSIEGGELQDQDIDAGTTVIWTNMDDEPRSLASDDGSISSGEIPPGDTFEHTFEQGGVWTLSVDDSTDSWEVNVTE